MRTFIGLKLPQEIQEQLNTTSSTLQGIKQHNVNWVRAENYHITFQFLGEVSSAHIADISEIMERSCGMLKSQLFRSPQLELVPSAKPRVLWVRYENNSTELKKAHGLFCREFCELGYKLDRKPLRYHVTLSRIKGSVRESFAQAVLAQQLKHQELEVQEIVLYESKLRPGGPEYTPLYRMPLRIK